MSAIEQARDAAEKISGRLQCSCSECLDSVAKSFMAFHSDMISKATATPLSEKLEELFYEIRENGSLSQVSKDNLVGRVNDLIALSKAAPSTPTVEEIMAAFDGAVEASTEPGDDDETQDWIDIKDVGVEFRSRLTKLLQQKGQAPSSKGE